MFDYFVSLLLVALDHQIKNVYGNTLSFVICALDKENTTH